MELIYEYQNRKNFVVFHVNFCFPILSFWGFSIMLFLICFFRHFIIPISVDYQYVTSNQQDFKRGHCSPRQTYSHCPWWMCLRCWPRDCWDGGGCRRCRMSPRRCNTSGSCAARTCHSLSCSHSRSRMTCNHAPFRVVHRGCILWWFITKYLNFSHNF